MYQMLQEVKDLRYRYYIGAHESVHVIVLFDCASRFNHRSNMAQRIKFAQMGKAESRQC